MYKLNFRDFIKGLIVSVITSVLVVLQNSLDAETLTFNWKAIGMAAIAAAVAYLLKNFFTDDVKAAEKVIDADAKVKVAAPNDNELKNNK